MTLEEFFFSFKGDFSHFPGHNDYISVYNTFKNFMNREVHKEIKTITFAKEDGTLYLNDHGENHVQKIIEKIALILGIDNKGGMYIEKPLSSYECFILLIAIQIHDAGHLYEGRTNHEQNCKCLLAFLDKNIVGTPDRKIIYSIARAHSGKDDPVGKLPLLEEVLDCPVRVRLLAALLRLGDEMADDSTRASKFLLNEGLLPVDDSKVFHAFSSCLNSFRPDTESHEVNMKFNLDKKACQEVFSKPTKTGEKITILLLDEIYERTLKTYLECLYFNRFVPEEIRFRSVKVKIEFYEDDDFDPFFDTIFYRLEENGYPRMVDNIFDFCCDDLLRGGQRLDGNYVKRIIESDGTN